jgi:hypothetical protein
LHWHDHREVIRLVHVLGERLSTLANPETVEFHVKLVMHEAASVAFLLPVETLFALRNTARVNGVDQIDENLCGICFFVQHKLVHYVEALKQSFSELVRIIPWNWVVTIAC